MHPRSPARWRRRRRSFRCGPRARSYPTGCRRRRRPESGAACSFPYRLEAVEPPIGFGMIQTADLSDWTPGDAAHPEWVKLTQSVRALIGGTAPSAPSKAVPPPPRRKLLLAGVMAAVVVVAIAGVVASDFFTPLPMATPEQFEPAAGGCSACVGRACSGACSSRARPGAGARSRGRRPAPEAVAPAAEAPHPNQQRQNRRPPKSTRPNPTRPNPTRPKLRRPSRRLQPRRGSPAQSPTLRVKGVR